MIVVSWSCSPVVVLLTSYSFAHEDLMIEQARCEADRMRRARRAHEVDERMAVLVTQKNKVEAEMVLLVHEIERDSLFRALGATSVTAYMKKRTGWYASKTEKIVALARNIGELPCLREKLVGGALGWTRAYLVSQVATAETDADWTEKALTLTDHRFEAELARAKGRPVVQSVTLKVSPAQLAAVDLAVTAVRSEDPSKKLPWGDAVAEACKRVVEGGGAGGSNIQVVIHVCAECHKATREGKNGPVEIPQAELEALTCDAEVVDIRTEKARLSRTIPARIKRLVRARDHGRCRVPECQNRAHVNFHHEGGWLNVGHDPLSVYLICVGHHDAIHDGDLIVRKLAPGRFEFLRLDRGLIGQIDLNAPMENPGTFRAEGPAGESAPVEDPGAKAFRPEGHAVEDVARQSTTAVAFLRRLEFQAREARDLVARALRSTPRKHWTADELVRAALMLVEQRQCTV
jgi:hypothetical protein